MKNQASLNPKVSDAIRHGTLSFVRHFTYGSREFWFCTRNKGNGFQLEVVSLARHVEQRIHLFDPQDPMANGDPRPQLLELVQDT